MIKFLKTLRNTLMTCKKPCANCTCNKPCGHLGYDDDIYIEIDDSSFAPRSLWAGVKEGK